MTKLTVIIATAIALLATILTPAHAQSHSQPYTLQSQTDWFVNDDPYLFGPQEAWYDGDSGHGYGNNNFVYTYGIGGEANADNWVHWYMGNRVGRQEIQVYVPSNQATATVNYNIYIGDTQSKVRVEQKNISGWHSLGRYNANGADVTIGVFDNDVEQHHARDGFTWSSIGIDAVAMRCVVNCSEGESGVLAPPRSVVAAPHGTNQIRVTWSAPANSGSSPISGYELEYSRPALRNHPLYGDRSPYNSGPVKVNESARSHTTGAFLRRVTYTVKVITISNDGQRSEPAITTATTAGSTPTSPTQPRNVKAAAHGTKKIRVTWSPPSDSGSASIKHYTVRFSRPAIGDDPAWSSTRTTTSTSRTSGNLRPGVTYTVTVTAVNRDNRASNAVTVKATTKKPGRVYIDDNPELEGIKGLNCLLGGTKSCWKHYKHGVNTYFKRPNDKEFIIERRYSANDFWGTNGFHVVYADPQKKWRATWEFKNVEARQYDVGVYLPDVYEDNRWQPGAIVTYRVFVDGTRVLTKEIDQSRYHNKGGRWVNLGEIKATQSSRVSIFVSSYWPNDSSRNSMAARPSGTADWTYHIAADAARLTPADNSVDWPRLGSSFSEAVAWCQVDGFITLVIEPLYNVLKGIVSDALQTAAISAAAGAVTAATGGAAAPVAALVVATRLGLSFKKVFTLARVVQHLRTAYRFLEKAQSVADYVDGIDTLDTLISHMGNIVTDPTGKSSQATDLDALCNVERVWENYYGEQSFWDKLKTRILEFFGKVIDWVT